MDNTRNKEFYSGVSENFTKNQNVLNENIFLQTKKRYICKVTTKKQ